MTNVQVSCRTCGSKAGTRCRTLATGRSTDTHAARIHDGYMAALQIAREEARRVLSRTT